MKQVRPTKFTTLEEVMAVGCKEVAGGWGARVTDSATAECVAPTCGEN